jgi:hypothetical protein
MSLWSGKLFVFSVVWGRSGCDAVEYDNDECIIASTITVYQSVNYSDVLRYRTTIAREVFQIRQVYRAMQAVPPTTPKSAKV